MESDVTLLVLFNSVPETLLTDYKIISVQPHVAVKLKKITVI